MAGNIKGISIEINGETTGLKKALADVNKESRDLQKELKGVETLLKLDPKNTELVAQKQKILSEQVSVTKEKLDRLKDAQAQVNEQYQKGEIGEEQYRDFQREVIATEQKLKSYETQLAQVEQGQNKFKDAIEKTSESLKNIGTKMTDIGKNMSMKVTAPIVAVGTASMAAFKDVDGAMDTIITKTGATGKAAEGLQESFKNISRTMPVDMQSVGDAIGEINTQFGLTGAELEKATEQMLKFAQINGSDVTASTQNAKAAIEAYGLSTKDLSGVLDAVTKAAQDTGLGVDQIYSAAVKGAPQIKALGLDFATAAQLMGKFEQKGIDSSKALSYLSKAQVVFAKDGKTLQQGLAELEKRLSASKSETEKLNIATEYFGTKGATFMLDAIQRGALNFKDFGDSAKNAAGAVSTTFEGTLDPIDKATVAFNNLKLAGAEIAASLQEVLAPVLDKIVELLQKFTDWFNKLSPEMKQTIVIVGMIAAAIGPVLVVVGQLITAVGTITTALGSLGPVFAALTGPIGIAVAAIAGAIAVGVALYKNWDEVSAYVSKTWEGIKATASTVWGAITTFFSDTWEGIKTTASTVWEGIKNTIMAPINALTGLISGVWNSISTTASTMWEGIKTTAGTIWEGVKNTIMAPINSLTGLLSTAWDSIKRTASNAWDGLIGTASDIFGRVKDAILRPFQNLHIPLPHFKFSTKKVSVAGLSFSIPDVDIDWYKKGAIFTAPQIVGVGEAGPEAVIPLSNKVLSELADKIVGRMDSTRAGGNIYQEIHIHSPEPLTPSEIARKNLQVSRQLAIEWGV